jgi:hypothetical protein
MGTVEARFAELAAQEGPDGLSRNLSGRVRSSHSLLPQFVPSLRIACRERKE